MYNIRSTDLRPNFLKVKVFLFEPHCFLKFLVIHTHMTKPLWKFKGVDNGTLTNS